MVNSVRKFFTKLINRIKKYFIDRKLKRRWLDIYTQTYSYGYIIESIHIFLIKMYQDWPDYKKSEIEKEDLIELIKLSDELLTLLETEDNISHIRTKEYLDKQNYFFRKLDKQMIKLFY